MLESSVQTVHWNANSSKRELMGVTEISAGLHGPICYGPGPAGPDASGAAAPTGAADHVPAAAARKWLGGPRSIFLRGQFISISRNICKLNRRTLDWKK